MACKEDSDFYKKCLVAHGYTFLQEEEDKSESDEESRSMKPPPVPYHQFKHKIVKISENNADTLNINDTGNRIKHNLMSHEFENTLNECTTSNKNECQKNNYWIYGGTLKMNENSAKGQENRINQTQVETIYARKLLFERNFKQNNESIENLHTMSTVHYNTAIRTDTRTANKSHVINNLKLDNVCTHNGVLNTKPIQNTRTLTNNYLEGNCQLTKESKSQLQNLGRFGQLSVPVVNETRRRDNYTYAAAVRTPYLKLPQDHVVNINHTEVINRPMAVPMSSIEPSLQTIPYVNSRHMNSETECEILPKDVINESSNNNPLNDWNSADYQFTRFEEKREKIEKTTKRPRCVVI